MSAVTAPNAASEYALVGVPTSATRTDQHSVPEHWAEHTSCSTPREDYAVADPIPMHLLRGYRGE